MNQSTRNSGFTLIELMLSMTFVSVLLLTIALTIIQMSTTYNRGMTMKEVNQTARDISDDLRRTVGGSSVFEVAANGNNTNSYVVAKRGDKAVGGRLCTGTYSYIWNTAFGIEQNYTPEITKIVDTPTAVGLYKVPDTDKRYCAVVGANMAYPNISQADSQRGEELLKTGDRSLGLQDFSVISSDSAQDLGIRQKLYTISYRIGTGPTLAMNADQIACSAPGEPNANWTYCNIQQFAIVVRAGNRVE